MKLFHPKFPKSQIPQISQIKAVGVGHKATENMLFVEPTARTEIKCHVGHKAPTGFGWQKGTTEQMALKKHTPLLRTWLILTWKALGRKAPT